MTKCGQMRFIFRQHSCPILTIGEKSGHNSRVETESTLLLDCGRDASVIQWAVVHTHPAAENWAAVSLNRAGYETYLPLYAKLAGTPRRIVHRPLFPSYIFLALPPGRGWVAARYAEGVHKLCMSGGRPNYCRPGAVEALQATEEGRRSLPSASDTWRPGAPCRLANGSPLDGVNAVVKSVSGDSARVHVLMFGELREVVVKAECLTERKDA
jgi:transcription antitermination factor NusG